MAAFLLALAVINFAGNFVSASPTVPELIRSNGYPCEEHYVTTEDGYILSLHRIPHSKNHILRQSREPVLMQHGLFSSSSSWTLNLTHKAPAYIMADAGYDVWMTNVRGNTYSKNHTFLSPTSKKFWQFSWDEMARYDLPAFIDYILKTTRHKQIYYIGHSMGTTIFFAGMTIHPSYNAKIKQMFALAPVGTVTFIDTWFAYFSYLQSTIQWVLNKLGHYEVIPNNSLIMRITRLYCNFWHVNRMVCENLLFLVVGFDSSEFDQSWMPIVMDELLSGTSLNTLAHYSQEYRAGRFQFFDYGYYRNEKNYGQIVPPEYHMRYVTAPVHLIWGMNDYLADDRDVQFLIKNLPNVVSKCPVPYKPFNHLDFLWAKDVYKLVFEPLLKMMADERKGTANPTSCISHHTQSLRSRSKLDPTSRRFYRPLPEYNHIDLPKSYPFQNARFP